MKVSFPTGCGISHTTHWHNSDPHVAPNQTVGLLDVDVFATGCCLLARNINLSEKGKHTIRSDSLGL